MQMETWMFFEPRAHRGCFMRAVVVDNEMDIEAFLDRPVDL